jgi:prepilin-type N-terminal cleavage/methylation domain-containing protein
VNPRDERGASLIELVVVMALLSVVALVAGSGLLSVLRTTSKAQERLVTVAEVRSAMAVVTRDVRAANPVHVLPSGQPISTYRDQLTVSIYCAAGGVGTCGTNNLRQVTFAVAGGTLTRTEGSATSTLLAGVTNPPDRPVFQYLDAAGTPYDTSAGSSVDATTIRDCTRQITISLDAAPVELSANVVLPNVRTGVSC